MPAFRFFRFSPAGLSDPADPSDPAEQASRRRRAADQLRQAAELVETTAFDEAGDQPTAVVSQLVMLAADLERLAQTIERRAPPA